MHSQYAHYGHRLSPSNKLEKINGQTSEPASIVVGATTSAALLLDRSALRAPPARRGTVLRNTTIVNADAVIEDWSLAVVGDTIAAIGPTDAMLESYPNADVIDGRGKAILPGLINCHGHLTAVLERGFNEDAEDDRLAGRRSEGGFVPA